MAAIPLTAASTCRRQPGGQTTAPQLQQEREQQPRAGHAERMPQGDSASVDVHVVAVELQLLFHCQILGGYRFHLKPSSRGTSLFLSAFFLGTELLDATGS